MAQEGAARNCRHANTGSESGWEKYEYPKPNNFEQAFTQWYAKAMADRFVQLSGDPEQWKAVWEEFGGNGFVPPTRPRLYKYLNQEGVPVIEARTSTPVGDYESVADSFSIASADGGGHVRVQIHDSAWLAADRV